MIFQNYWSLFAKKPTAKDSGEARKKPVMDSGIRIAVKNSGKMKRQTKLQSTSIFYIGKTASNLAASAYRSYADGENAIDGVIETLSVMLRIEFENTKQKEDAKSIGAALPVTQAEKWLSDTEMSDGVCMLSMTRKILEAGRKEGFDIGYLKGLMAAQSKEQALQWKGE